MLGISYWVVPLFSGFVWLGMLLGMLLWWTVKEHSKHLIPMNPKQHIAYISDIGAHELQPLFIAMGTVTVVTFNLTFITERWLRHQGRLVRNDSMAQKILAGCSIIAACIGGIGLICLTCLNDVKHDTAHDTCLVIFIGGYIISAIFLCAEYQRLGIHHREYRHLRISFWIKLAFIFVEVALALAFGILRDRDHYNSAAVTEWVIALIYAFYVWSFTLDFIPVVIHKDGFGSKTTELDMAEEEGDVGHGHRHGHGNGTAYGMNGVNGHEQQFAEPSRNF